MGSAGCDAELFLMILPSFGTLCSLRDQFLHASIGAYYAGQGALIGNGQCGITKPDCGIHQLFGARRATQETEVGYAVQFGVGKGIWF